MKKIVLTGAAGRLGSYLREPLSKMADQLVSTDIAPEPDALYPSETYVQADISDYASVLPILEGADMVVHFGAIVDEVPFEQMLGPNFVGAYNVWEAAYQQGVRRVVYASSIHAVGMHTKQEFIGVDASHRPDSFYGLSKCFTEDLARMYWDKRKVEAVCLRIFSCAQVNNTRSLGTWLSYDDLIQLVTRSVEAPATGFTVVYGISNNDRAPVDNSKASYLGYRPKDNAEVYAAEILAKAKPADPTDPSELTLAGPFAIVDLGESALKLLNIVDDSKKS